MQMVPRRRHFTKSSASELALDSVEIKHPKFANDPGLRILPPLVRNLRFLVASVAVWVGIAAACVASIVLAYTSPHNPSGVGLPRTFTPVEVAMVAVPWIFVATFAWMFWDFLYLKMWGTEEVRGACLCPPVLAESSILIGS